MAVAVRWGVVTHPGRVRSVNQDSVLAGPRLFVVADGMGGHAAGDVASALAVAALARLGGGTVSGRRGLIEAMADANLEILSHAGVGSGREGMGTTVAGVCFADGDDAIVFNVGDSRVYRLSAGGLEQISEDHSVVAEMQRSGNLTAEEAAHHPERHVITRALGTPGENGPDLWTVPVAAGDRFLVCSDGLTNEVDAETLGAVLGRGDPQDVADELLRLAMAAGARDNVSAVVVEVVRADDERKVDTDDTGPRRSEAAVLQAEQQ